ncbi:MAG: HEAT repeat domain-containing protein [Verrucomicrobiales bacterium]|nr:HEAT repeat domain-containing protein [Verrucomicrobiales bacterium]
MRWKPRRTTLALTLAACAVGVLPCLLRRGEPVYDGQSLTYWIGRQVAGSFRERADATQVLTRIGPEAVPTLTHLLARSEHSIGQALREQLSGWFPDQFSPPPNPVSIRQQAITLLGRLGPPAASAAPALLKRLESADPVERQLLEEALLSLGSGAGDVLAKGLQHPSREVRTSVAKVLPLSGVRLDASVLLPPLQELSQSEDAEARCAAARALTMLALRQDTPVVMDGVRRLAQDSEPMVAFGILSGCDPAPSLGAFPAFESFREPMPAGADLPPPAPQAWVLLADLMEHPSAEVRAMAAARHWQLAHDAGRVLPVFTNVLQEPRVIWMAASGLRAMGPAAEPAIPALLEAVPREPVHRPDRTPATSAMALAAIGPAALPGLRQLLDHPELNVRLSAAHALRQFGPAAADAVPGLIRLLEEPSDEAKTLAGDTLGIIGPAARRALPRLETLEQHSRGYPQAAAAEAIRRIRQPPPAPMSAEPGPPLSPAG